MTEWFMEQSDMFCHGEGLLLPAIGGVFTLSIGDDPLLLALIVGAIILLIALAVFLITRLGKPSRENPIHGLPPSLGNSNRDPKPGRKDPSGEFADANDPITGALESASMAATAEISEEDPGSKRPPLPTEEEVSKLEKSAPLKAAVKWGILSRWEDAARCYEEGNDPREAARIYLSLGNTHRGGELLRRAITKAPGDEKTRLLLISLALDAGNREEAMELIEAVTSPDSPVKPSADFLSKAGRQFEAALYLDYATNLYRNALAVDDSLPEIQQRVLFLKHNKRLASSEKVSDPGDQPRELLQKYLADTQDGIPAKELEEQEKNATKGPRNVLASLPSHDVIVGHLALGCQREEPQYSVESIFALSKRYHIQRLLSESDTGAVFEATDELLDFPVALKLFRLPAMDEEEYQVLKDRLRLIAQLNHPNLAKMTFADRQGVILRVTTEFLPGGNLRDFLHKLGGVGVPLLVRMGMHLSSALHTAHLRGVPHGDLRPENILIGPDQRIKLIDFSLSPIPICKLDESRHKMSDSLDTPRIADLLGTSEGIQSDLVQLGDVLEFMLENARQGSVISDKEEKGTDPMGELREVVMRLRNGSFTSVLRLWQVLEQIFDRAMQSNSSETQRSKA
ncbi:MAG: protein kinase [Candidatus Sumerlaeia bacterium]|nr:protein kinase [Candidatus Sumerlaeia bacterium]